MNHLVAIVGPTATGKSQLAIRLAQDFDGQIVNADSRQIYRFMDIGTAKPSPEELSLIPHHLINIVSPDEDFSLARYQELANQAITEIQSRNKLALLVGGSGQYIWSILEGWNIPQVPPDLEFRRSLEERAISGDSDELYQELLTVDPVAAQKIGPRNIRRIIRALEVYHSTKVPISQLQQKHTPPFDALILGLTVRRSELYRRIDRRVDAMIERGLVAEVESLLKMGYHLKLPALSSIGYKQIGKLLNGELALETAIQQIKYETHRFVRHQHNWFRLKDNRIKWFDIGSDNTDIEIINSVAQFVYGVASTKNKQAN